MALEHKTCTLILPFSALSGSRHYSQVVKNKCWIRQILGWHLRHWPTIVTTLGQCCFSCTTHAASHLSFSDYLEIHSKVNRGIAMPAHTTAQGRSNSMNGNLLLLRKKWPILFNHQHRSDVVWMFWTSIADGGSAALMQHLSHVSYFSVL